MSLLVCENLHKSFGGLAAVNQINVNVGKGELLGIIGPNGAGKTTFFNLITGFLRPTTGKVEYEGEEITHLHPHLIAARGLIRTFQKINVFGNLLVLENVLIGRHRHFKTGFLGSLLQSPGYRSEEKVSRGEALQILKFVGLSGWENQKAQKLSLGMQRALGIAVALVAQPKLLLLDEPASGMTIEETNHIMDVIRQIHGTGITILLVEHNMKMVMNLCQRIVVLDAGRVVAEGNPEEIQHHPRVIEVYLGKRKSHAPSGC